MTYAKASDYIEPVLLNGRPEGIQHYKDINNVSWTLLNDTESSTNETKKIELSYNKPFYDHSFSV